MFDDDTGAEPAIVSASFADPYLLLLRDDSSIFVAHCDDDNELEEIEREDDILLSTKWLSGSLYADSTGAFANTQSDKGQRLSENIMMFLLSASGALYVSPLSRLNIFANFVDLCSSGLIKTGLCCRGFMLRTSSSISRLRC
jgi:cleavage and polyadenylation specificity factor subunit 1